MEELAQLRQLLVAGKTIEAIAMLELTEKRSRYLNSNSDRPTHSIL